MNLPLLERFAARTDRTDLPAPLASALSEKIGTFISCWWPAIAWLLIVAPAKVGGQESEEVLLEFSHFEIQGVRAWSGEGPATDFESFTVDQSGGRVPLEFGPLTGGGLDLEEAILVLDFPSSVGAIAPGPFEAPNVYRYTEPMEGQVGLEATWTEALDTSGYELVLSMSSPPAEGAAQVFVQVSPLVIKIFDESGVEAVREYGSSLPAEAVVDLKQDILDLRDVDPETNRPLIPERWSLSAEDAAALVERVTDLVTNPRRVTVDIEVDYQDGESGVREVPAGETFSISGSLDYDKLNTGLQTYIFRVYEGGQPGDLFEIKYSIPIYADVRGGVSGGLVGFSASVKAWYRLVEEADEGPIQVDAAGDEDDGNYSAGQQTLREALKRAGEESERVDIPLKVERTISLTQGEIELTGTNANLISLFPEDLQDVIIDGGKNGRIFRIPEGKKLELNGLTLQNGRNNEASPDAGWGGGAIANRGELSLFLCILENNDALAGGAIRNRGVMYATTCRFEQNEATLDASGAIDNEGQLDLRDCIFVNNRVTSEDRHAEGGALANFAGTVICFDCDFIRNTSSSQGGAVYNNGTMSLTDCKLELNEAHLGGAILAEGGPLKLTNCEIAENQAEQGGAIRISPDDTDQTRVSLRDCHFRDNNLMGASIYNMDFLHAVNCITQGLTSTDGGPHRPQIENFATAALFNCTVVGIDGALIRTEIGGTTQAKHCIIGKYSSSTKRASTLQNFGDFISLGYNLIEKPPNGFAKMQGDITEVDLPVVDERGRTNFNIIRTSKGIVMRSYSPAINAGDPEFDRQAFDPPLTEDLFGNPRVVGTIDIGALEVTDESIGREIVRQLAEDEDKNANGIPDLIDVITGIDPSEGSDVGEVPIVVETGGAAERVVIGGVQALEHGDLTVRLRLDERVDFIEGTLQTSPDLVTWTDRATYLGQGAGGGIFRSDENGVLLLDEKRSGYGWFLRESVPATGGSLYARLTARLLVTQPR